MQSQLSYEDIEVIYKDYLLYKNHLTKGIKSDKFGQQIINYIQQLMFCLFLVPVLINKGLITDEFSNNISIDDFFLKINENKNNLTTNLYTIFSTFRDRTSPYNSFKINSINYNLLLSDEIAIIDSQIQQKDLNNLEIDWSHFLNFIQNTIKKYGLKAIESFPVIYERDLDFVEDNNDNLQIDLKINRFLTERRKKGVYYTPQKITFFMNESSIFLFLKNKTNLNINNLTELTEISDKNKLNEIYSLLSDIKILDLSCGSGDFLIESANQLFDIFYFLSEKLVLEKKTLDIKREILERNLYGVDLLSKAISITMTRLWLWYIKDIKKNEFTQNITNIKYNLKAGNSLIGWDDNYEKSFMEDYTEQERGNIKPFNWESNFSDVLSEGGFDIILGNPPYIEIKKMRNEVEKKIFALNFMAAYKLYDISILFIERGLTLLKEGGILNFIITNKFIVTDFGLKIRELLLTRTKITNLVDLSYLPVFVKTAVYPIILTLEKSYTRSIDVLLENNIEIFPQVNSLDQLKLNESQIIIKQRNFYNLPQKLFIISANLSLILKMNQIDNTYKLEELGKFAYRLLGFTDWSSNLEFLSNNKKSNNDLQFIGTTNVASYIIDYRKELVFAKKRLKENYLHFNVKFGTSWTIFLESKLLIREIAKNLTVALDPGKFANATGIYMFIPKDKSLLKFLLIVLNSKLLNKYYSIAYESTHMSGGYLRFNSSYLKQLPIVLPKSKDELLLFNSLADFILLLKYLNYVDSSNNTELEKLVEFYLEISNLIVLELYFNQILKTKLTTLLSDSLFLEKKIIDRFGKSEVDDYSKYTLNMLKNDFLPLIRIHFQHLNSNQKFISEKAKIVENYSSSDFLSTAME
ncbi:MAG: Eco57I restriction-modification methylase domain-containing protein [Candidatus Heimdallarchaeota archaeon]|nr:Eco57I restriction-modification methylase domain-containing protein [Candidatus Heimdallarchaeota archaeon]